MTGAGEAAVLRSAYDPDAGTVSIELEAGGEPLPAGWRLALTSIVQLTPPEPGEAVLVDRLASYHELAPASPSAIGAGATWRAGGLRVGHPPRHAVDGPASAFVILPDGTTAGVGVEAMRRVGDAPPPSSPSSSSSSSPSSPSSSSTWGREGDLPVVPHPVAVTVLDRTPSGVGSASFVAGPDAARAAWRAVAALCGRGAASSPFVDDGGMTVRAAIAPLSGDEAYRLTIEGVTAEVEASTIAGFRHAFVTLAQLVAAGVPGRVEIEDAPRHPWRGLHVDLARQWLEPDLVERLIDVAARRKLSRLHLHLTDDEGWRLPVAGLPELGSVGGTRGHGLPIPPMLGGGAGHSGRAYTPDEIGRWVERADELGVVLVPEIDLPAHVHAALVALPSLRDPDDGSHAASVQFFEDNVLVPGHLPTMPFVEAVVAAVAELFPTSPWIHVGGDEVPDGAWRGSPVVERYMATHDLTGAREVEAAFHRELAALVRGRHGRRVGAWQEAAESGGILPGDGYVVGWRTVAASRELAARGHDVVVSPGQAYYLDMATDGEWATPGASWAGATSLADVCAFEPDAGWSDDERAHLIGIQACLWTEHVHDEAALADRLFPRLDAVAERAWTGSIVGGAHSLASRSSSIGRTL